MKFASKLLVGLLSLASFANAQASTVIDPAKGAANLYVGWAGSAYTGQFNPVSSFGEPGNTATISVASNAFIAFSIRDLGHPGDAFALQLDGVTLTPTSGNLGSNTRGASAQSFFSATYSNIFLSAGSHTFGLYLTDSCCTSGATIASFSATVAAVPEPETYAMLLGGLGLIVGIARRKQKH